MCPLQLGRAQPRGGAAVARCGSGGPRPHGGSAGLFRCERPQASRPKCANPTLPLDVRQVPTVRLQTVLCWLAWQGGGGWPIDYLKLDARGLDMEVLRSAGDLLPRVLRVQIDIQGDSCEPMYEGSLTCSDTVKAMREMGYTAAYNRRCGDFDGICYEESRVRQHRELTELLENR